MAQVAARRKVPSEFAGGGSGAGEGRPEQGLPGVWREAARARAGSGNSGRNSSETHSGVRAQAAQRGWRYQPSMISGSVSVVPKRGVANG